MKGFLTEAEQALQRLGTRFIAAVQPSEVWLCTVLRVTSDYVHLRPVRCLASYAVEVVVVLSHLKEEFPARPVVDKYRDESGMVYRVWNKDA